MNRAFISLYALVTFSIIGFAWGLDKLWEHYHPADTVSEAEAFVFTLVEHDYRALTASEFDQKIKTVYSSQALQFLLFEEHDFSHSLLSEQLSKGEIIVVSQKKGERQLYKKISEKGKVLRLTQLQQYRALAIIDDLLLVVFYLGLALVIFFWVWPLSKDLRKLEQQTQVLGSDNLPQPVKLKSSSTVYRLAQAFNVMSERIRSLLSSYKEMTYAVSHELRTPLARMKFALEIAQQNDMPDSLRQQLRDMRNDVGDVSRLVNELLSYASFEHHDAPLDLQSGDMESLIRELVARLTNGDKALAQVIDVHNALGEHKVVCEWYLMEHVITNLLQNALRFYQSRIKISLALKHHFCEFVIEDDGPGIAAQNYKKVFQSFARLDNKQNAQVRGFGLGLAIVKRLVSWHQGHVTVERSSLGGAKFTVSLPQP